MKHTRPFILPLCLLLSLLLSACAGAEERSWQAGQRALAEENYSVAAAAFEKAGAFQDADRLRQYAAAWQALENGDYAEAEETLQALGDFKDSILMLPYCRAREQESLAEADFSSGNSEAAVNACASAYELYRSLPLFRDSDTRAASCRDRLYAEASAWMALGHYEAAAVGFGALGSWLDSADLQKYCVASGLEEQAAYAEAAALFSEIEAVQDASERAENARVQAYQQAVTLRDHGDYEAASEAFASLGSYRDAETQRDDASVRLVRALLRSGSFAEALERFSLLRDPALFPEAAEDGQTSTETFLIGFVNAWMNAHASVMNAFFSCSLLQPYLEPGGELDTLVRTELEGHDAYSNYGYLFNGAEIRQILTLDDGFAAARVHAGSSFNGPDGHVEQEADLWVLLDTRTGSTLAAAVLPVPA